MASLTLAALAGWLASRSRYAPALRWWAAGSVCASAAALLNVSQGLVASHWALVVGNPLMAVGVGLLIDGTHRLAGRPSQRWWWAIPALCLAGTSLWWGVWYPHLPYRVVVFTAVVVWLMAGLGRALWPLRQRGIGVGLAFVAIAALLLSLLMVVRAVWALQGLIQPVYALGTPFTIWWCTWWAPCPLWLFRPGYCWCTNCW